MSVSAAKSPFNEAYGGIKNIVNDANRQIRNFNLKTIAKIIALLAVFTLGGAFSISACLKMGLVSEIAGIAATPFVFCAGLFTINFIGSNIIKTDQFIKNLNEDIVAKLNKYPASIRSAVDLVKCDFLIKEYVIDNKYGTFVSKIPLNSYDRVNKKYEKDIRRHLPAFLQFSNRETMVMTVTSILIGAFAVDVAGAKSHVSIPVKV